MTITDIAHNFDTSHAERTVLFVLDDIVFYGFGKTWPAGTRFKLLP